MKKIVLTSLGLILGIPALVAIFGYLVPYLISAPSTPLMVLGFLMLLTGVVGSLGTCIYLLIPPKEDTTQTNGENTTKDIS